MATALLPWHDGAMRTALDGPSGHLTLQFLAWIGEAPRRYGELMDAWRTSCPRLSIWEDALQDGLIEVSHDRCAMRDATVTLTDRGRILLQRDNPLPDCEGVANDASAVRAGPLRV
jgi:hypothetical protein